jgi:hypothetical protein
MKINITLSMDEDVVHYLKGQENYSKLANDIIKEYIEGISDNDLPKLKQKLEEIKQKQAKNRRKKKEITQKIKKIKEKESKILKIYQTVPQKIIRDIQSFPNINIVTLRSRFDSIYKKESNVKWMDIKKVFEEVKGGGTL